MTEIDKIKEELEKIIDIVEYIRNISPETNNGIEIVKHCDKIFEKYDRIRISLLSFSNDHYLSFWEKLDKVIRTTYEEGRKIGFHEGNWEGDEHGFNRGYSKGIKDMRKLKEF